MSWPEIDCCPCCGTVARVNWRMQKRSDIRRGIEKAMDELQALADESPRGAAVFSRAKRLLADASLQWLVWGVDRFDGQSGRRWGGRWNAFQDAHSEEIAEERSCVKGLGI